MVAGEAVGHAAEAASHGIDLLPVVALLAAGVIAVPLFKRLGLGSVLGYLAAGLLLGPSGLEVINDPASVLHLAELGVVMFLFIIGLEMEPSRLWSLRKQILGLGVIQVAVCGLLLTGVGILLGFAPAVAFVFGMGFVLTSTAIVMQILGERGELSSDSGQRMVSILLLEDLAIVPLLAVVAILAPTGGEETLVSRLTGIAIALGAIGLLIFLGRRIMNPFFSLLASTKLREVMTAAALLVVLGAALLFQVSGLSMAMGAFLAGVLLSTSTFRHQLEADVEPFRGILLGLFFLAVGMSLDLAIVLQNWGIIAISVAAYMLVKAGAIYAIARALKSSHGEALERAVLMGQGGEFAFVLYTTAATAGLIDGPTNAIFTATVIISMVLTPFFIIGLRYVLPKEETQSMEGVEKADGLSGKILIIGFGRFGQIASQPLLAMHHSVSIIDNDTEMVRVAAQIGFKVYYGDGTRLDILHAAGAGTADVILICTDKKEQTTRIAELLRDEFPLVRVMARAFDRGHAMELIKVGVEYQLREMFESALTFGGDVIKMLGASEEEAAEVVEGVRDRDRQRFEMQLAGADQLEGSRLLLSNARDQAREGGVVLSEEAVEDTIAKSTQPAS
ncbi:monovalent cation:proton antiporter-2 (CPA2) family protein [Devosia neptuniae]|uniref:Monovalent cation:proton antiporter-2 (CPA2) family protein n=1 Tax=Devosia neptuniae TaxID=191302 RepID=A0ABY6C8Y8_9HYPH|nr:monovalent cation:proton antiporter-2 (CPA2) family protein [Devosia neptuniae]UXN68694.1 monovalent cation:proton antiporter-2 (CPA2) family protein [Devosia neptuniae]